MTGWWIAIVKKIYIWKNNWKEWFWLERMVKITLWMRKKLVSGWMFGQGQIKGQHVFLNGEAAKISKDPHSG